MNNKVAKIVGIIILISLVLSGCSTQNIINDKDSGEIEVGEKEYLYYDGTYNTYSSYYANDGYFRVMKLKVEDGKVCEIIYDLINEKGERFSEKESEEAESFKSEIKSLNSKVMQNQTYKEDRENSLNAQEYKILLEATLDNALKDNQDAYILDMNFTYESHFDDINGNTAHLSVEYSGEKIRFINYYITSSNGLKLDDYIEEEKSFSQTMNYSALIDYLEDVPQQGDNTLKKENVFDLPISVIFDYNQLCDVIEERHRRVDEDKIIQLFSSL